MRQPLNFITAMHVRRRVLKWLGVACLGACCAVNAYAGTPSIPMTGTENPDFSEFEKKLVQLIKRWKIPGAACAMMKDDKLIYARGFGWLDQAKKIAVKPNSQFRIASVSKAITAVGILKLVEEKKLRLSQKVFSVLSDLRPLRGQSMPPEAANITVKDLLYMMSGWIPTGRKHFDPMFGPWSQRLVDITGYDNLPASCYTVARTMLSMPMPQPPGKKFSYSNFDYCLLGLVISKVTADQYDYRAYERFFQSRIFAPLHIHMHIGSTKAAKRGAQEVFYYRYHQPLRTTEHGSPHYLPYSNAELLQKNFANGGWVTSAIDLVTFAHAVNSGDVLTPSTVTKMLAKPEQTSATAKRYYAMGWKVKHYHHKKYWYQTGSFTGSNALLMNRSDGTSIAIVFNSRPPTHHLWRRFRPRLKQLFHTADAERVLDALNDLPAIG
jgi:CubicO group peptidase (beta-lactamase class C family)